MLQFIYFLCFIFLITLIYSYHLYVNELEQRNFELQKEILFKNLEIRTIKSKNDDVLSVQSHQ